MASFIQRPVLISGVYRSGTTFANAAISCFDGYSSLSSGLKFMRFCFQQYGKTLDDDAALRRLLEDAAKRLLYRWHIKLPVDKLFRELRRSDLSYSRTYDVIVREILGLTNLASNNQWVDKLALGWDLAEDFLDLFPEGVVLHVIRNPVDVLKSFQAMTTEPRPIYLDAIFNCYSSFTFAEKIRMDSSKRVVVCRVQDLAVPTSEVYREMADLLGRDLSRSQLESGDFSTLIDDWKVNTVRKDHLSVGALRYQRTAGAELSALEAFLLEKLCGHFMDKYSFEREYEYEETNLSDEELKSSLAFDYLLERFRLCSAGQDPGPSYYSDPVVAEWRVVNDIQTRSK